MPQSDQSCRAEACHYPGQPRQPPRILCKLPDAAAITCLQTPQLPSRHTAFTSLAATPSPLSTCVHSTHPYRPCSGLRSLHEPAACALHLVRRRNLSHFSLTTLCIAAKPHAAKGTGPASCQRCCSPPLRLMPLRHDLAPSQHKTECATPHHLPFIPDSVRAHTPNAHRRPMALHRPFTNTMMATAASLDTFDVDITKASSKQALPVLQACARAIRRSACNSTSTLARAHGCPVGAQYQPAQQARPSAPALQVHCAVRSTQPHCEHVGAASAQGCTASCASEPHARLQQHKLEACMQDKTHAAAGSAPP